MKYITHITDHVDTANGYLLEQYKYRPKIKVLLDSLIQSMQDIEDTAYDMYIKAYLTIAVSYHLDKIGAIIGVSRKGRNDDDYRLAINLGIIANNSGGTPEEILAMLKSIYSEATKIEYMESGNAYFQIYIESSVSPKNINALLEELKPAGVSIPSIIYSNQDKEKENLYVFRFAERVTDLSNLTVTTNDQDYELQVTNAGDTLEIIFDKLAPLGETNGFAEIIVNRLQLGLNDGSIYLVNSTDELEILLAFSDFTIKGGSPFAELITT